jgi:hypothetical protein
VLFLTPIDGGASIGTVGDQSQGSKDGQDLIGQIVLGAGDEGCP